MTKPEDFYREQAAHWKTELQKLKKQARTISMLRLGVFLLIVAGAWLFWGQTLLLVGSIVGGIANFLFLVSRSGDLSKRLKYAGNQLKIQENELRALQGDYSAFQTGNEFLHDLHPYNQDIDLFGEGSLFPRIDRCETGGGRLKLANLLNSNDISNIEEKQAQVRELCDKPLWRQHFKASAGMIQTEVPSEKVLNWMKNHRPFLPSFAQRLSIIFSVFSLTLIALYALEIVPYFVLLAGFFLGLGIAGRSVKRVNRFYNEASTVKETLAQYSVLLEAIESENFESSKLKELKNLVQTDGKKASAQLKDLAKLIDYLGNRNNMLFGPIANGFFLWDLYFTSRIDHWFQTHNTVAEDWMTAIESFDALNALGNFAYNHPTYYFPEIAPDETVLKAEQLAHPLIHPSKVVPSDFEITDDQFYIVTGANMAGKSTFLRTISLSIVMSNCGMPVSARSFAYTPIPLISSMRTSDSLQNEESYFFSELKRLKYVVDTIQHRPYFIVLDEILKGTNSQDKAEGSKKFVERLLSTSSVGIIATHDLSLCDLEKSYPQIQNRYFDAEIINDELHFDYRLKMGVCQNMNASFLLKKMEII